MRFELLFLGKTKEKYLAAGIEDFKKRLSRYAEVDIKIIKDRKWSNNDQEEKIKAEETAKLLDSCNHPTLIVALDPTGKQVSSEELAELIQQWESNGHRKITFIIGGPLGFANSIRKKADTTLSLSRMTFTHEMARLLLLEQLYRACSIKVGSQYHK